jgi:2-C-methyl-D-erythritol 4-phosphate cytidylyltransferase
LDTGGAIAIIFAGGTGSRMGPRDEIPKQFRVVGGRPILVRTLEHFEDHEDVHGIYLSCLSTHVQHALALIRQFGLTKVRGITPGGETSQHSILNALRCAVEDGVPDGTIALIHDGVRPVITPALITANVRCAEKYGSAITAIPCFETIAMSLDGACTVESVPARQLMHVLQAPQTFLLGEAYRMNVRSLDDGLLGSFVDQAQLMNHYGGRLRLVPGLRGNVKITTDFDLVQFRLMVEAGVVPM